jgi:hypothetical protein
MIEQPCFQVGVLVPDIECAMHELGAGFGFSWGRVLRHDVIGHPLEIVFSRQGPRYIELIHGPGDSPWDCGGTTRMDHLGFWSDNLEADKRHLINSGVPLDIDGALHGRPWTYHRVPATDLRIELIDTSSRQSLLGLTHPE